MESSECRTCKHQRVVIDSGYKTCVECGVVVGRELDESNCGYHQVPTHAITPTYTRMRRFKCKILGGLQRRLFHKLDQEVYLQLKSRFDHIVPPETFLDHLLSLDIGRRKPYIHVAYYYEAIFNIKLPLIPAHEEALINRMFKEVFFASDRLQLPGPTFPMSSLLRLIVDHFEFSLETQTVVRFAKRLRCQRRRRKYRKMFLKCCSYIYKHERTTSAVYGLRRKEANIHACTLDEITSFSIPQCVSKCRGNGEGAKGGNVRPKEDDVSQEWSSILLMHPIME